jgi:hypothetical protein
MTGFEKINAFTVCLVTAAGTYEGDCEMIMADNQGIIDEEVEKNYILKKIKTDVSINLENVVFYPESLPHHKETLPMITLFTIHIIGVYLKERI